MTRAVDFFYLIANSFDGEVLGLARVSRLHIGAYLCIASNGVPPSVSKRIVLNVQCEKIRDHNAGNFLLLFVFSRLKWLSLGFFLYFFHLFTTVAPVLWIPNQLEGTVVGQQVSLVCQIEAFPIPIVYWTTESGEIIIDSMNKSCPTVFIFPSLFKGR